MNEEKDPVLEAAVAAAAGDLPENAEAAAEGEEAAQQFIPPKVTMLRPNALNVQKFPDGSVQIEMMITPFEVVGFGLPAEAAQALIRELSGGIEIARSLPTMAVPKGRGR